MSLGNVIKDRKKQRTFNTNVVSLTLPAHDWRILVSILRLLGENIGKLEIPKENEAIVRNNCIALHNTIINKLK